MRLLIVGALVLIAACAKSEEAATDSAAAATPAALTEADQAGTWVGTAKGESGDTTTQQIKMICEGNRCAGIVASMPDTGRYTFSIAGDSVLTTSEPMAMPGVTGKVVDVSVHRITGTSLAGYGWVHLADKPDSVVFRYRFQATKQ